MILDVFSIGILIPLFANLTDQIKFDNEFFNLILSFLEYEIFKQTSSVVSIIILIFLFKNLIILLLKWFENELTYGFLRKNSKNLLNFYINKNYLFHLNNNSSELIKNIQGECNIVSFNILRPFLSIISLLISVITILILLIGINAKITIVTILFFSIIGIIFSSFTKKILKKLGKDRNKYSGLLLKSLQQTFSSIREIIISNKKVFFLNHFDNSNAKVLQSGIKSNFIYSIPRSIIEISLVLLIGAIIIYLDTSKILFTEIILTLTTFLVGASRLMPGISNIFSNISVLIYNLNSLNIFSEDFFNFLKTNKKDQNKKQISFKKLQFKNANFRYPGRTKKIISNLNLDLKFNDKIGIIGDTGSGKSTLINILTGLLKLNKGEILIDGLKIKSFNRDWYNIISYVPQNILTLDENLKDNITLGEKKINSNYLNKIYKILNLNEVKKRYSNSSTIGERGSKISGGQNQRIGLARAFYKKSKILILDEALNSIDVRLRDKILDSIFEIYKDKLVILVSHQIDALKKFNIILKVEDGKIVRIRKK
tara:strand:+ start:310 stop:1932 length:1623 start_codon:yes stop_codon:yes gene_type:complete